MEKWKRKVTGIFSTCSRNEPIFTAVLLKKGYYEAPLPYTS